LKNLRVRTHSIVKSFIWITIVLLVTYRSAIGSERPTGEMVKLSYLLGQWTCKEYLRDTNAIPSVITFEISGPNAIHEHWVSAFEHAESDSYFGYSTTAHVYYVTRADSGEAAIGSSADGITYSEAIQGIGGPPLVSTFTFQSPSSDTLKIHSETTINGMETDGWADCSR
jgi:hypothetical protein